MPLLPVNSAASVCVASRSIPRRGFPTGPSPANGAQIMVALEAGCLLERLPPPSARKSLHFFEYAPRAPLPTFSTLAKFRKLWGSETKVALVCPRSSWTTPKGPFREGPELDAGVQWVTKVADILNAFAIVVAPGADLTPGGRDRQLLGSFVKRLKSTGRQLIIAPRGLWEAETAAAFAAELGCLYGFDPLEDAAPAGKLAYARVRPMGARPRLTDGHLLQVLQNCMASGCERLFLSIESEDAYRAMKRVRGLAEDFEPADLEDDVELDFDDTAGDDDADDADADDADADDADADDADADDADADDADADDADAD
jgi:hypothetical protein